MDGQLIGIDVLLDPSKSKGIAYDDLNRLAQVAEGIPVASGGIKLPIEDYAYDEKGNRTASHLSVLYASNDHNQLLEDQISNELCQAIEALFRRFCEEWSLPSQTPIVTPAPVS